MANEAISTVSRGSSVKLAEILAGLIILPASIEPSDLPEQHRPEPDQLIAPLEAKETRKLTEIEKGVDLIDEADDTPGLSLDVLEERFEALLELAADSGTGEKR